MPKMIKRNFVFVAVHAFYPLGTRTNQAHVTFEDVPKLRQFIEPRFAQPSTDPRNPRIPFARINIVGLFRAIRHRAKLVSNESLAFPSDPNLVENRGASVFQPN